MQGPILCMACIHLTPGDGEVARCEAYPDGIPEDILAGGDHHAARGDEVDGLTFRSTGTSAAGVVLSAWRQLRSADETALTAAAEVHTGAMIAFLPAAEEQHRLALADAEAPDQLHVTAVYLGEAADWDAEERAALLDQVAGLADGWAAIEARAFGVSILNPTGEEPCLVLNLGGQELADRYGELAELGASAVEQHAPWLAHVTLAYHPDPRTLLTDSVLGLGSGTVLLDRVRVAFGGENTDLALGSLVARAYTRDSHGQFSSTGGGASGDGMSNVRDSLRNAGTTDEVGTALEGELQNTMGRHVLVDFGDMDTDVAKEHAEGILRGAERYPDNNLQSVQVYTKDRMPTGVNKRYAEAEAFTESTDRGSYMHINNSWSPGELRDRLSRSQDRGRVVVGSPMGVTAHEMGHVVTQGNQRALLGGYTGMLGLNTNARERPETFVNRKLSNYATTNEHELVGEAMSDVLVNGDKARDVSKAVIDGVDAQL